jgi:hypothetical protein
MPTNAFDAAALLEEIAKHADPLSVLQRSFQPIIDGTDEARGVAQMIQADAQTQTVRVHYMIPVETVMKGVDGTPEQISEWLQTGVSSTQQVKLENDLSGKLCFIVCQVFHNDKFMIDEMRKLARESFDKAGAAVMQRKELTLRQQRLD